MTTNVDRARHTYELWNGDDVDGFRELMHPEFVYRTSGVFPGFEPEYRGHEGMIRFRDTMLEAWERLELRPVDFEERGDDVIVALRFFGTGRESGVAVEIEFHHLQRFRDGLLAELVAHPTRSGALAAAGLS
jgi:ketosteroid isomerase-like protein